MWKAYYGEVSWISVLLRDSIPDKHHFVANGYANAWYIDKTGTYTITLYFKPQSLLYVGAMISIITLIITVTVLYLNRCARAHVILFALMYARSLKTSKGKC